jgi:hypothetical protein
MGKTNFERFIESLGKAFNMGEKLRRDALKRLEPQQSVIEVTFISTFEKATQKSIHEEIADFYENAPLPFVEIYETEIFKTHVVGRYIVHTSFAILVAAPAKIAKHEIEERCHKVVETEHGIEAYKVTVDRSYS